MRPWRLVPASVLAMLLLASAPARAALVAVPPAVRFGVVGPGQLSSAVIVTTFTDCCGFALSLGLATLLLQYLT